MSSIDDVITYIETQIGEVLGKMINARTKHLAAIEKMLDKMNTVMKEKTYLYRQGRTYDRIVKVERSDVTQYDIEKPTLKLNYVGGKMSLKYDTETIDVPEVPIFEFTPVETPQLAYEAGVGNLENYLYVMIPAGVDVEEAPDAENAFGKYYKLSMNVRVDTPAELTFSPAKPIGFPFPVFHMSSFKYDEGWGYIRTLTIDGSSYDFQIMSYPGRALGTIKDVDGASVDIGFAGVYFVLSTNYGGNCYFLIGGNSYARGEKINDLYEVRLIYIELRGTPVWEVIE